MLELRKTRIVYGRAIEAVREASLNVVQGEIVALLGANGAGKSTTLKAISGLLGSESGEVVSGEALFEGRNLSGLRADEVTRLGVALVPEGRRLFAKLTVRENLVMGAITQPRADFGVALEAILALFPALSDKLDRTAGFLSGGEQQMVAIGRALMSRPRLLLLDEPSLGLAPLVVREIFKSLRRLREERGVTILLIEQNATLALDFADRAYVMENGRILLDGPSERLKADPMIRSLYLGLGDEGLRRNLRQSVSARQRERWPA